MNQKERIELIKNAWQNHGKIELWKVFVLADMAETDTVPDGSFSDAECCVWNEFRRFKLSK